jgi:hypothetical protein
MYKTLSKLFAATLITVIVLSATPMMMSAKAQPWPPVSPSFWVSPETETFLPANASVGTLFNVTVWAAAVNGTAAWGVQLGFNVSQLQVVTAGFSAGATSQLFASHSSTTLGPVIDNIGQAHFPETGYTGVGSVEMAETLLGTDYIDAANASVFYVTFNVTAAPAPGQTFTSLIDPAFGLPPDETLFILQSPTTAYPYGEIDNPNTAPCTYSFSVTLFSSSMSVVCSPTSVSANSSVTCNATVSGADPTGTVDWGTSSSTGNFSQPVCTLSSGTCSTNYTDSNTGYVNITASYSGDSNNLPSSGSTILTVFVNIEAGTNVTVTPTNNLELTFANVTTPGFVVANATSTVPAPNPDLVGPYYVINVTASFSGNVTVSIAFDGSNMTTQDKSNLTMIQYTPIPGDVIAPFGLVDIRDIHFIALLYGTNSTSPNWNPLADLNGDGKIDIRDVHIAAVNYGKTANWINITLYVDTTNNIVYGQTTHFSFIGIHG